ncbi:hypothetical protein SAMN04489832_5443 [Micromonospora cremea]|uniref:DUF4878 domain-containing protein n=1 Tax=Micromonospora cremea TaxID=709881 RepID=A0A1N6AFI8_9ACTN|nr:hypothetical protein SAMN04489832_5443 [Micromonospora cremea]
MHTPSGVVGRRSWGPWAVAAACVVGLLVAAIPPVLGFLVLAYGGPDIDEPRAAADRFVQHLEQNQDEAAYRSMCSQAKDRITVAEFTEAVERLGRPVSHDLGRAGFGNEAGSSAFVTVRLTDRSGATTSVSLRLETEPGWRVCSDTFG